MQKALLIAEKPSLRRSIEEVYNKHKGEIPYDITFMEQRGHLVTLKLPSEIDEEQKHWCWENLPFHPEEHGGWQYKVIKEQKQGHFLTAAERYKAIGDELKTGQYDFVIHAGDPDQEGELLVNLVLNGLRNHLPVKRFWTNDLTEGKVLEALKNLRDDQHDPMLVNLMQAAVGRQHSDYRFGMNVSEAASLKMNTRVACGRVKTPILAIVCKRENEIKNFKPVTVYGVTVTYDEGFPGQLFDSSVTEKEDEEGEKKEDSTIVWFKTREEAQALIDTLGNQAEVVSFDKKKETKFAPKLFKLATAQIAAGKFGYSSAHTLEIIQGLYEKKFLSYPRTDCEYISSSEDLAAMLQSAASVPSLAPFVAKVAPGTIAKVKSTKKWVDDNKLKDSGHSALVPTSVAPNFSSLSQEEQNIYEMICKQFVAIFLPPLITEKTVLVADIDGNKFKSNGKTLIDKGYTELLGSAGNDILIPSHSKGDVLGVKKKDISEKTSTCPKRFTDAGLIAVCEAPHKFLDDQNLKALGKRLKIGTPATRASIIEQLIVRDKYLQRKTEKKTQYIVPTPAGMEIYEALKNLDICKVDMTGEWEELLEQVRGGSMTLNDLEGIMKKNVEALIRNIHDSDIQPAKRDRYVIGKCPECGGDLISSPKGFYCSNWKTKGCKVGGYRLICDSSVTDEEFLAMLNGEEVEKELKKGKSKWKQRLKYDNEAHKFVFVETPAAESAYVCPNCGKPLMDDGRKLSCNCGFTLWKTVSANHKELTKGQLDSFFENGDTGLVKGLMSKKGKKFDAHIVLSENKKGTSFAFDN